MISRRFFFLVGIWFLAFVSSSSALNGNADPAFLSGAGISGQVFDMDLQADGGTIVGGDFTSIVGFPCVRLARLDATGRIDTSFNARGTGANGTVYAVRVLPDGRILVGGAFTQYNGSAIRGLVRLNPDGSLDPTFAIGAGVQGSVWQISLQPDNRILISGGFTAINGTTRRGVARLNHDGTIDQSLQLTSDLSLNGPVEAIALQVDGRVVIGGSFYNTQNGQNNNIARVNSDGSLDSTFNAATNSSFETPVRAVALEPDGQVLIGGQFTEVNGLQRFNIARLNSNGTLDNSFTATTVNVVSRIGVQADGKIVVSGRVRPSGIQDSGIGRLNSNGTSDLSFSPTEPVFPWAINTLRVLGNGQVLAGGNLSGNPLLFGGASPAPVRRLNTDGTRDQTFLTRSGAPGSSAQDIHILTNGKILLRGPAIVGGLERFGIARLNADGTVDEAYAPTMNGGSISSFADGSVAVGGIYSGGNYDYHIKKLNPDGSADPSYLATLTSEPNAAGQNVSDMVSLPDGKLLAVGNFVAVGGVPRKAIVRLNPNGSMDQSFNPNLSFTEGRFHRIVRQPDGKLWISASFTSPFLATAAMRLSADGIPESSTPVNNVANAITDIAYLPDGGAYICGNLGSVNSVPRNNVARIKQNGTLDLSFTAPVFANPVVGFDVYACLAQPDGKVIVGGSFTMVGAFSRRGLVRLNTDGSVDPSFNPGNGSTVIFSLAKSGDGRVLVGGDFTIMNGLPRRGINRLLRPYPAGAPFDFDGDGKTDIGIFRPSVAEWWIQHSGDGNVLATQFGAATDHIVPADYTGDGKSDVGVWRPASGEWFVLRSDDFTYYSFPFGANGDVPATADYDADGKADATVFRPSTATWYVFRSTGGTTIETFGASGDIPVPADYDGDGKADLAIFRPSAGQWWINRSTAGLIAMTFGNASDKPVQGDYTGDGKADVAFWRPSTGDWFVLRSEDFSFFAFGFGTTGDVPAPGDYDGDGKFDATVFRPSNASWYSQRSSGGTLIQQFGASGDRPIPNAFVP